MRAGKLCTLGRLEEAQREAERYVDTALRMTNLAGGPVRQETGLYSRIEVRTSAISRKFLLATIRRTLVEDQDFQPLRGTPAWAAMLERLEGAGEE